MTVGRGPRELAQELVNVKISSHLWIALKTFKCRERFGHLVLLLGATTPHAPLLFRVAVSFNR